MADVEMTEAENEVQQITIRPDRSLLNPHFDKYILATHEIPVNKALLNPKVQIAEPSNSQWSRNELKLFSLVSPIVFDVYRSNNETSSFVYVDAERNIRRVSYGHEAKEFSNVASIKLSPPCSIGHDKDAPNSLPVSLIFGAENIVFIANGAGGLAVYGIQTDGNDEHWKLINAFALNRESRSLVSAAPGTLEPFIIGDVRKIGDTRFEVALLSVFKTSNDNEKSGNLFSNAIYWFSIAVTDTCKVVRSRCYHSAGNLEFVTFSSSGDEIIISAAKEPMIVHDSALQIKPKSLNDEGTTTAVYTWTQSHDELVITFHLSGLAAKDDINVTLETNHISIFHKDAKLLEGALFAEIKAGDSTWTIQKVTEDNVVHTLLEVILHKKVPTAWLKLVPSDTRGHETTNDEAMEGVVHEKVAPTTMNPNDLEEVDEEDGELNFLFWISDKNQGVTRTANLSFHKILFTQHFKPNSPLGICIREDVDGVVYSLDNDEESNLKHELTLDAFGYIQAGKSSRRFTMCSPNGGYSAIVDGRNHAYIYLKSSAITDTELRNRKTQTAVDSVARQYIVSLNSVDPDYGDSSNSPNIVFSYSADRILFIATDWALYACHVV